MPGRHYMGLNLSPNGAAPEPRNPAPGGDTTAGRTSTMSHPAESITALVRESYRKATAPIIEQIQKDADANDPLLTLIAGSIAFSGLETIMNCYAAIYQNNPATAEKLRLRLMDAMTDMEAHVKGAPAHGEHVVNISKPPPPPPAGPPFHYPSPN